MRAAHARTRRPWSGRFAAPFLAMFSALFLGHASPAGAQAPRAGHPAATGDPVVEVTVTPERSEWTVHLAWWQGAARFHVAQLGLCIRGYLDLLVVGSLTPARPVDTDRPLAFGPTDSFAAAGEMDLDKDPVLRGLKASIEADIEAAGDARSAWKAVAAKGYDGVISAYLGLKGILQARSLGPAEFWSRPSKVKVSRVHVLLPDVGQIRSLDLFCYTEVQLARAQELVVGWAEKILDGFYRRRMAPEATDAGLTADFWKAYEAVDMPDELSTIRPKVYRLAAIRADYPRVQAPEDCAPCRDLARAINGFRRHLAANPGPVPREDGSGGMLRSLADYNRLVDAYRACLKRHACIQSAERYTRMLEEADPFSSPAGSGDEGPDEGQDAAAGEPVASLTRLPDRFVTGSGRNVLPQLADRCADEALRRLVAERCAGSEETDLELARVTLARQLNDLAALYDESAGSAEKRRHVVKRWREGYARYKKITDQIAASRRRNESCIWEAAAQASRMCAERRQTASGSGDLKVTALTRDGNYAYAIVENRGGSALVDVALELMFLRTDQPIARSTHVFGLAGPNRVVIPPGARVPVRFLLDRAVPGEGTLQYGMRWKGRTADKWTRTPAVENLRTRYSWGYGVYIYVDFDLHNTGSGPVQSKVCLVGLTDLQNNVMAVSDFSCEAELAAGERRSFSTILNTRLLDALGKGKPDDVRKRTAALKPLVFVAPEAASPQR